MSHVTYSVPPTRSPCCIANFSTPTTLASPWVAGWAFSTSPTVAIWCCVSTETMLDCSSAQSISESRTLACSSAKLATSAGATSMSPSMWKSAGSCSTHVDMELGCREVSSRSTPIFVDGFTWCPSRSANACAWLMALASACWDSTSRDCTKRRNDRARLVIELWTSSECSSRLRSNQRSSAR